jgi:phenylpropionate dioxygenase-like ring-hydroxylating dioxygenase large terminal subunit
MILRDGGGALRAFHNLCRHRGARLLDAAPASPVRQIRGGRIVCPYHAWAYDLEGRLAGLPCATGYPAGTRAESGLLPASLEVWHGLVFVSAGSPARTVAEWLAPLDAYLAPYRIAAMQPLGRITLRPRALNWKLIVENYLDRLHVPIAHPGLTSLVGDRYQVEVLGDGLYRMSASIEADGTAGASARLYCELLSGQPLPAEAPTWQYFLLWPNTALDVYPDQIDFMQMLPLAATETLIREIAYGLPDTSRRMRLARYLNWRINRRVNAEDTALLERVHAGLQSGAYAPGPVSADEPALVDFLRRWRAAMGG